MDSLLLASKLCVTVFLVFYFEKVKDDLISNIVVNDCSIFKERISIFRNQLKTNAVLDVVKTN